MSQPRKLSVPDNNFDILRLGAALAVLASHSFQLSYGNYRLEPVWRIGSHQATLGRVAVIVFFIVSGYLITGSYSRRPHPMRFVAARALRLLPGLAAMLALLTLAAGPLLTTAPIADYFAAVPAFFAGNLSVFGFIDTLPGVFETNPLQHIVNGSLWTLVYEVECYGAVLLLGMVGCLNRWTVLAVYAALMTASKMWLGGVLVEFGSYFAAGAVMHLWAVPLRRWAAIGCVALLAATLATTGFRIAAATAGAYLVVYLAMAPRPVRVPGNVDLSYGAYIYAFPVQQATTLLLGAAASWWLNIAISLPIVLALAWASWRWVEAPSLGLLRRHGANAGICSVKREAAPSAVIAQG